MEQKEVIAKVTNILASILKNRGISQSTFQLDEALYEDGIGLDSLDAAELSVILEHAFGTDPYSKGQFPSTVGDIVRYYTNHM